MVGNKFSNSAEKSSSFILCRSGIYHTFDEVNPDFGHIRKLRCFINAILEVHLRIKIKKYCVENKKNLNVNKIYCV